MTKPKKNRVKGIVGTVIFHSLILLAFIFFGLTTPLPLPGEEGVEVNLGNSDYGSGEIQQEDPAPTQPPPPAPEPPSEDIEEIVTQESDEAPAIEEIKEEEEQEVEKDPVPIEEEIPEEIPEEVPPEEPKVNPRALYKPNANQNTTGGDQGITGDPGDQGKTTGTPESNNYTGPGGDGNGISYSLGGRGVMALSKPEYNSQEQGKVVVTIYVNREGKVVKAEPGAKGTNISDARLKNQAKQAALRSTFAPDPTAPELQKGTITYNFIILS